MATSSPSPARHAPSASMSSVAGFDSTPSERASSKSRSRARSQQMLESSESSEAGSVASTQPPSPTSHRSRTPKEPLQALPSPADSEGVEWLTTLAAQQQAAREANETPGRLVPPLGFAMVSPGVYRSGHPNHRNFAFLEQLQLKSIMYLCSDRPRPHTDHWAQERRLKVFHYPIESAKDPSTPPTPPSLYAAALANVLDRRNLPMLIHCNKGKHRVGTLCAILRRLQGWTLESAGAEWIKAVEEGAPPGSSGLWSPPVYAAGDSKEAEAAKGGGKEKDKRNEAPVGDGVKRGKDGRIKDKAVVSRTREREWEYIRSFPLEVVMINAPEHRPSWLPEECVVIDR